MNNLLNSISDKRNQISKLSVNLNRSLALQSLIPNVFDKPNIKTQWTDKSLSEYTIKKLNPKNRELAKFRIYSGNELLGTFSFDQVPEILKVFNRG